MRCGKCSVIFNGSENIKRLRSGAPADSSSTRAKSSMTMSTSPGQGASSDIRKHEPVVEPAPDRRTTPLTLQLKEHRLAKAPPERMEAPAADNETHAPQDFAFGPPTKPYQSRRLLRAGMVVLSLALALAAAWLYSARDFVVENPVVAEWANIVCPLIGCKLRPRQDLNRIEIIGRNVFTPPGRANVLRITATLANKAPFAQPYPLLQVSFTNLQGTVVATHRFTPREYLPGTDAAAFMAPNVPIKASVEIPDPGTNAAAYEFAFYALPD